MSLLRSKEACAVESREKQNGVLFSSLSYKAAPIHMTLFSLDLVPSFFLSL